jgi:hypothetical protein
MHRLSLRHVLPALLMLGGGATGGQTLDQPGFSRLVPGWTNYSTAFNATHAAGVDAEFATVGTPYAPAIDVRPLEYSAVVIWFNSGGHELSFDNFIFQVHFWSSIERFALNPRQGDLHVGSYNAPTGGSTTVPDAITRGGRPAYLLRFSLTNDSIALTQCQAAVVGLVAQAKTVQAGEFYVPTAPFAGPSDVQGGNIVPFGWGYVITQGGLTIYSGQLATELKVEALGSPPSLSIARIGEQIELCWPGAAGCYTVESTDDLGTAARWEFILDLPIVVDGSNRLRIPAGDGLRFFRLQREPQSVPVR